MSDLVYAGPQCSHFTRDTLFARPLRPCGYKKGTHKGCPYGGFGGMALARAAGLGTH